MNPRNGIIRWVRRIGTAALIPLLIPYLDYLCEFASRVYACLGSSCPHYIILMADLAVSWNVCYFLMCVVFILVADYGIDSFPKLDSVTIPLMFVVVLSCVPVMIVMDYLNRSTIPTIGGFYDAWPDSYWDWPSNFTVLAVVLVALWIGSKVYVLFKRRRSWGHS